jgi:uncharacterized protein (DUF2147 family)
MKPVLFAIVALALGAGSATADPLNVFGTFATEEENSHVEIAWIDPASVTDGKTPETATDADGKKILGLTMLEGFRQTAKGWTGGTIYNPKEGKTYSSRMKLLDDGVLEVKGCIAMLCETQNWNPVG